MKLGLLGVVAMGVVLAGCAAKPSRPFGPVKCEGEYPRHLQGVCTDEKDVIFWSWTEAMVKTDRAGKILKSIPAADHHGDLCFHDGKVYVAVNLGKFNEPAGKADSWVYVYRARDLKLLAKHPVPELVHGAGGMWHKDGRFIVIGGLPKGVEENYAYEYDERFKFLGRHVIASGYTLMGIQTAAFGEGHWWFGCYGKPQELLKVDPEFKTVKRYVFNASLGIVPRGDGTFLVARGNSPTGPAKQRRHTAELLVARMDEAKGLVLERPVDGDGSNRMP